MANTPRAKLTAKTCKEIADLIADYLTDRLKPPAKRAFKKHLSICPDCVKFLNTYKKTAEKIRALNAEDIPPKVRTRVLALLRQKIHRVGVMLTWLFYQLGA